MKLLFVYRFCSLGGVETSILNKLEALRRQGIEGYVLFSEFYGVGGSVLADHPRVTIGLEKQKTVDFLCDGYDAISVIDYPDFLDVMDAAHVQTRILFESHASFPPALDHYYSKVSHPGISAIVVPSQFNKELIERATSTTKDIVVIPNPINRKMFSPRPLHRLQQRFRQLGAGPVIVWVGRLEDEKNPLEFTELAQRILESRPETHFIIVGDTFDYEEYKDSLHQAIKVNWRNHFTFYQSVPYNEMPEIYSLAAETGGCLVSTSLFESAPMTFIEAMACKCPVVSTDVGGVKEIITDNVSGRLYSTGDMDGGVKAIVDILSNGKNSARRELVENALTQVAARHSLDLAGQRYRDLLDTRPKIPAEKSLSAVWRRTVAKVKQIQNDRLDTWRTSSRAQKPRTNGNDNITPGELGLNIQAQRCADIVQDSLEVDHVDSNGDVEVRAVIEPQSTVLRAYPGQTVSLPVRVVNESTVSFRGGEFAFELSYHLLSVDGSILQFDNPRSPFTQPLCPGEERVVDLPVRAPNALGLYYLGIHILRGPVAWPMSRGNPTAIIKFVVGENIRESKWWLQVHEGNLANLVFPPDHPERVRIAIGKAETITPWHIQLNKGRLSVKSNQHYAVKFQGRADRARRISVAVSKAHPPWDGLGVYREIELLPEWRTFQIDFVATADDDNARVHFDVGGSDDPVELSAVMLCSLLAGQCIEAPPLCQSARLQMDIGVKPLSHVWGTDRGLPVHRYYLEQFLSEFASDIRGCCLEFQDPQYTPRFGGSAVVKLDILHIDDSNPKATLVADLTEPNNLPSDHFDCIVCPHVLHVIFEVSKAVSEIYRVLKPGGVLLVAVPQVSMCDPFYHELWRFTPEGLEVLLARVFGSNNVTVRAYGNSLTAAGEIRGVVVHEFATAELDHHDPRFAVEVCARAVKPG